jgi:hypothetical protein
MSKRKHGPITAAELMAELEADPEYQAAHRERERLWAEREAMLSADEVPLIDALRAVGVEVESVWDLVNRPNDYQVAYPVLVEHLHRPYHEMTREGIARALIVADAADVAWRSVVRAFVEHPHRGDDSGNPSSLKFALGCALGKMMEAEHVEEAMRLAEDRSHSSSRAEIVHHLGDFNRRDDVRGLLQSLVDDPNVATDAKKALARKRRLRRR